MNVNSSNASVADAISSLMTFTGGADASELALMYVQLTQIDNSRAQLNELVTDLDNNSKLQRAIRDRMDKLNRLKDAVNQAGKGEGETRSIKEVDLAIHLYAPKDEAKAFLIPPLGVIGQRNYYGRKMFDIKKWVTRLHDEYPMTRDTLSIDKQGQISVEKGDDLTSKDAGGAKLTVGSLDTYITELKGQSDELSNKAQQLNLFTQSTVNAVQRATTFVSGLLKSMHDTNMAPIRKIG